MSSGLPSVSSYSISRIYFSYKIFKLEDRTEKILATVVSLQVIKLELYNLPYELHDVSSCTDENQQELRKLVLINFALWQYPSA